MNSIKDKQKKSFDALKKEFGYKNVTQGPKIEKVIVGSGIGSLKTNKDKVKLIKDRLTKITGQKVMDTVAKKSIASFGVREGNLVGYKITLRGDRMFGFLDKLINVAIPRTKDFRGIPRKNIDEQGNITIGIPEHVIFPETSDEEIRDVFGFSITIVTSSKDKKEATAFFEYLGFPLQKLKEKK